MKRSLIAIAALMLLLSSATYASPPRPKVQARFFWGPLLAWFGFGHHHDGRMARHDEYGSRPPAYAPDQGYMPPGHRGRPYFGHGWHRGRQNGRYYGWNQNDGHRGWNRDNGEHRDGEGGGRGQQDHGHERGRG